MARNRFLEDELGKRKHPTNLMRLGQISQKRKQLRLLSSSRRRNTAAAPSAAAVMIVGNTSICITGSGSIAFMQMSEQQVHAWSTDANQYVADEDEITYSCRVSGSLLLEEIVISCGIEGVYAILNAAKQRLDESQQQRVKGSAEWWRNAPTDVVKAIYEFCFDPVVRTVLQSDDHGEMQNATQCLAALISGGKQQLLTWGGDPGYTMRCLLDVASRLLDPDLESSGSLLVGNYILQLILHLSSQMAQHIRDLVAALVRRM
ncbi:hypothetical protein L2E82_30807 [Cichorium intybus]|uniref:Uncharacterized protein n=1 Tax=Cichorium intybus TaxID=13427 RepID=A0ACB9D1B4_CICIN|nr:hypothetical protein L2E82_30807 [Cichorium intybus]